MEKLLNFKSFIESYKVLLNSIKAYYNEIKNAEDSIEFIIEIINKMEDSSFILKEDDSEKLKNSILYLYQFYFLRVQDTKVGFDSFKERVVSFIEYISTIMPDNSNNSIEQQKQMINSVNSIDTSSLL
ncbi:hypothetical protein RZS08_06530 [Arthrospira platensis SPKY1]|nr:hypothetical protein [Arthrospira platensis SPKY1]